MIQLRPQYLVGLLLLPLVSCSTSTPSHPSAKTPAIRWVCSTEAKPWQEMAPPMILQNADPDVVKFDPQICYQPIDGFGGCFNELAWDALRKIGKSQREEVLKALFDRETGCGFSLCRVPIGANDFALEWYSFDETPGDFEMKHFSIERDRRILIPFIKSAMSYQPSLAVWGVPWCPPSWMTTSGAYKHGSMKQDPQTLAAYALYFSRFVEAYHREGVNLYAVHPQNEPSYNNNVYPQCKWNGQLLNVFLRDHLLPQLKKDNVNVEVWMGTIVSEKLGEFIDPVLGDPVTGPRIAGVGYQWNGRPAFEATHQKYPGKKLLQTETECNDGANSWDQALMTFSRISDDLNHYANGYDFWNMVLNETGKSSWGWRQNCLVTVDTKTGKIIYNPEFYSMKHFSHFVPPGSHRISAGDNSLNRIAAFQTPAGDLAILFSNVGDAEATMAFAVNGKTAKFKVPAKSMNTAVLSGW
jgi:glucosylceramidase